MIILKNIDNFSAIKKSTDISEICYPLSHFKINFFNHIRIFNNGTRISLSNRGDWLEHFFKNQYYNKGNFSRNYQKIKPGYLLWNSIPHDGVLDDARNNFQIDNGITIVKKYDHYIDLFLFASVPENYQVNNFYINNYEIINHFINYYYDKSKKIIEKCKPDILIGLEELTDKKDNANLSLQLDLQEIKNFFMETKIKKYKIELNGKTINISFREYQCIELLKKGKSIKEISLLLNLSQRTAYFYIDNLKNKLSCSTKSQLLIVLSDLLE